MISIPAQQQRLAGDRLWSSLSLAGLAAALLALALINGPASGADSVWYTETADAVLAWLSGVGAWPEGSAGDLLYLGYVLVVALGRAVAGEQWLVVVLSVHALLMGVAAASLYALLRGLWPELRPSLASVAVIALPMANPEVLVLARYVLTDIPFTGLAVTATALLLLSHRPGAKRLLHGVAWLLFPFFLMFRPDALSWVAAAVMLVAVLWLERRGFKALHIVAVLLLLALATLAAIMWFIYQPQQWPLEAGRGALEWSRDLFAQGVVVHDQRATYSPPPQGYVDFMLMALKKALFYFRYWNENYSGAHNLYRHLYFGLVFSLCLYYMARRPWYGLPLRGVERALLWFTFLLILINDALHVITVIAYEFRYQLVIFGGLWPMALLGLRQLAWDLGFGRASSGARQC
jgi:hypothetical protein